MSGMLSSTDGSISSSHCKIEMTANQIYTAIDPAIVENLWR
ncbi:hypothetical protein [Candidatus Magnetomonas plexicatena]